MRVVVVGAGIVGVATALRLIEGGATVTLVDRGEPGEGTSYGNAGVLASCSVVPVTVPGLLPKAPRMLFDPNGPLFLKWGYLPRLAPFLTRYLAHANDADTQRIAAGIAGVVTDSLEEHQSLAAGTGAERYIVPGPYRFAYSDRAHYAADGYGWAIRRAHGFVPEESDEVASVEPVLGDVGFLASCPDHGRIIDPGAYVKALAAAAVSRGARLVRGTVTDVAREGSRVTGVRISVGASGTDTIPADAVVIATGAWSRLLAKALGVDVPLESERGYHVELWEPSAMPTAPVMFAAGKFVATPMEGRIRVAGLVEFGGLDAAPSRAPFRLLMNGVRRHLPGVTWRETREWMGHRPAPADSLPLIGEVPAVRGAFLGFGHHHIGLTAGPRTGRLLAGLVFGRRPNIDTAAYAPARFANPTGQRLETTS
jgi:D-amino-acid dehydrogenase